MFPIIIISCVSSLAENPRKQTPLRLITYWTGFIIKKKPFILMEKLGKIFTKEQLMGSPFRLKGMPSISSILFKVLSVTTLTALPVSKATLTLKLMPLYTSDSC
jgi:hypothetical protein